MAAPFSRTLRSLEADDAGHLLIGLGVGALLLVAWALWAAMGGVTVYAYGPARIERTPHRLGAEVAARVLSVPVEVGDTVAAGDVLVELDSYPVILALDEESGRWDGAAGQQEALKARKIAAEAADQHAERAGRATLTEAQARATAARAAAEQARIDAARIQALHANHQISDAEHEQAQSRAQTLLATAEAEAAAAAALGQRLSAEREARKAQIAEIDSEIRLLDGTLTTSEATMARLQDSEARYRLLAPLDGVVADIAPVRAGEWIAVGTPLVTLLPEEELQVIAALTPADAVGRVQVGQPARLRLEGFSWTTFGAVTATVTHVASEPREGTIRVELAVVDPGRAPLVHGLPGTVEIAVEQVSPLTLLLRAAGFLTEASQ